MRKLENPTPDISIHRLSVDNADYLEIFIDTPSGSKTRTPKLFRVSDDFTELTLSFEGFDSFNKDASGQEMISGDIYMTATYASASKVSKYKLASPSMLINTQKQSYKRNKISNTASLIHLSKEIKSEWQAVFSDALDNVVCANTPTQPMNKTRQNKVIAPIKPFEISGTFGVFLKTIFSILMLILLAYVCLSFYNKTLQVKATSSTVLSLNPEALAKNQKDVVDETFKEIGIDREKLTSDLSCFVEE